MLLSHTGDAVPPTRTGDRNTGSQVPVAGACEVALSGRGHMHCLWGNSGADAGCVSAPSLGAQHNVEWGVLSCFLCHRHREEVTTESHRSSSRKRHTGTHRSRFVFGREDAAALQASRTSVHTQDLTPGGRGPQASARRMLTSANGRFKTSDKKLSFTDTRRAENSRK